MERPILVVDDDPDMRRVVRDVLGGLGPVAEAADGADALRQLREGPALLVVLDVAMPGLSGIEVLSAALELRPDLRVLMLTGDTDLECARMALDIGAGAYVTKPFDGRVLRSEALRLLEKPARRRDEDPPWRVRDPGAP
jgi:CheY-like chemotaxis protein